MDDYNLLHDDKFFEREFDIKTLDGKNIRVSVSSNSTVSDLRKTFLVELNFPEKYINEAVSQEKPNLIVQGNVLDKDKKIVEITNYSDENQNIPIINSNFNVDKELSKLAGPITDNIVINSNLNNFFIAPKNTSINEMKKLLGLRCFREFGFSNFLFC